MRINLLYGITCTLLSAFFYAVLNALIKHVGATIPIPMFVFFQSFFSLIFISAILLVNPRLSFNNVTKTSHFKLHLVRTLFSVGISYFLFFSLKYIPLVDAVVLGNTAPLFVPVIAFIFLSQPFNNKLWLPIIIGFVGVIIILQPGAEIFNPASLLAVLAAICMASSMLMIRKISAYDGPLTSIYYYFLISTVITSFALPFYWADINLTNLIYLSVAGVLFFMVQSLVTMALNYAPTQTVSISYYSCVVFSIIIGYLVFKSALDQYVLAGIVLIVWGGIMCIRRQSAKVSNKQALFLAGKANPD